MVKKTRQKKFDWLFIFIVYSDYRRNVPDEAMKTVRADLFKTLGFLRLSNRSKVAIIHNQISTGHDILSNKDVTLCSHVAKYRRGCNRINVIPEMTRHEIFLMQKQEALASRINALAERFPAQKHCIVTCDHGSIFGISATNVGNIGGVPNSLVKRNYHFYQDGAQIARSLNVPIDDLQNIEQAPTQFEILTSDELAKAIRTGLGKKAELVIMYNCCMQTIMTLYALKEATEYLIAPSTMIGYPGYNFEYVLNRVFRRTMSCEDVIDLICGSFTKKNRKYYGKNAREIDAWAVWAIKPALINCNFINRLNELADYFSKNLDSREIEDRPLWCSLARIMPGQYNFDDRNSSVIYDLKNLMSVIKNKLSDSNELSQLIDNMTNLLQPQLASHKYIGVSVRKKLQETNGEPASGYFILFPKEHTSITPPVVDHFFNVYRSEIGFLGNGEILWAGFITKYLSRIPLHIKDNDPCAAI